MRLPALKIFVAPRSPTVELPSAGRDAGLFPSVAVVASSLLASSLGLGLLLGCGSGALGTTRQQAVTTPVASALGPQLGYIWVASDHTLRPILGVSGSSRIGQSLVPAGAYVAAASSATANLAVLQDATGAFDLMTLPSGAPIGLGVTLPVGARIRLSPSARVALLYAPGATSASLVTGLPSAPLGKTLSAPGPIAESAVSDSGAVAFEYTQGTSLALAVVAPDGHTATIAAVRSPGGLNFLPVHDDLLFADGAANSLTLVRSASTAPSALAIATQLLKSPAALGVSPSGRWALVLNNTGSASQTLVRVDLTTLATTQLTCGCGATTVATLADEGAFRITDAATGPNWIVDAAPATPRTLFIPALPSSSAPTVKNTLVASGILP